MKRRVIKISVDSGFVGAKHEDEEELPDGWDSWTLTEQEEYLRQVAEDFMVNCIEWGAYVEEVGE